MVRVGHWRMPLMPFIPSRRRPLRRKRLPLRPRLCRLLSSALTPRLSASFQPPGDEQMRDLDRS